MRAVVLESSSRYRRRNSLNQQLHPGGLLSAVSEEMPGIGDWGQGTPTNKSATII
jgi:hypothetical protein